jgi:HK97 family phage prohead protease
MKKTAQKMIDEKRNKATEMIGKKLEVCISRKAITIDEDKKTVTFVMSTSNIDRHGDIIDQDSWILDHFLKSPMMFLQHRSDEFPIGKWIEVHFEDDPDNAGLKMLVGTAEFATEIYDQAKLAFEMVKGGFMQSVSVGFIPHRVDYDENRDAFILLDCELLECSLVGVGSNRQALAKEITEDARENAIDSKKLLDEQIKKSENNKVIAHLKARENLNKAIRRLKF